MFLARITHEPLNLADILSLAKPAGSDGEALREIGARIVFSGEIRGINHGRKVARLEYTAHTRLAEKHMREVLHAAAETYPLIAALCIHRVGMLEVSESAVVVVTCGRHRHETYAANQYIINRVKAETPIWKREFFTDGSCMWGENCGSDHVHPYHAMPDQIHHHGI